MGGVRVQSHTSNGNFCISQRTEIISNIFFIRTRLILKFNYRLIQWLAVFYITIISVFEISGLLFYWKAVIGIDYIMFEYYDIDKCSIKLCLGNFKLAFLRQVKMENLKIYIFTPPVSFWNFFGKSLVPFNYQWGV